MSVEVEQWSSQVPASPSTRFRGQTFDLGPASSLPRSGFHSEDSRTLLGSKTPSTVDEMSTAYQPVMATYGTHGLHNCSQSLATSRSQHLVNEGRTSQQHRQPQQALLHPQAQASSSTTQTRDMPAMIPAQTVPGSSHTIGLSTPSSETVAPSSTQSGTVSRRGSETLVFHSLQIPKCISPTGGNLAEFAAQMTCLFWFQSVDDLKQAESIRSKPSSAPIPRLPALAKPYEQFRKWVYTVLSTTQVTQNVILLALLFIYRLKMSTPQIKGRAGSEYRLLTVALMLGNKCE
jgi:hypothetical protein